jgi:hypothetical membrane protein
MEPDVRPRRPWTLSILLASGAAAGIIFIAAFSVLGVVSPGYDFMRNTISALELTSVGLAQQANFIVFGSLMICFALGLRIELRNGKGAAVIPLFQSLSACAVIGDGIFVHEPMHMSCDLVAFNATLATLFMFAWRFWKDPLWKGWTSYSIATAVLMMGFLGAFGISNGHGGPAGAFEKLAVATRTTWSVLLVTKLLRGERLGQ